MAGGAIVSGPGGRTAEYQGRVTGYVLLAAAIGACTGLVFGYDIGVGGGVAVMPEFLAHFFPEVLDKPHAEGPVDPYCKYDDVFLSLFLSSIFLSGIIGALVGGRTCTNWGRRPTMVMGGAFFLGGAILMACSFHLAQLIVGRLALGMGVGLCVQAGPLFLSELAPYHLRGAFNTQFQLFITIGILAAQIINYGTQFVPYGWRISLGLAGVPAALLTFGALFCPETPNSLVERGRVEEAQRTLVKIRGTHDVSAELEDIIDAAREARASSKGAWTSLFSFRYLPQLVITIALPAFNQLDGINSIMFYAPQLFDAMGSGPQFALLTHLIIGAVNVLTTLVAVFTVDRLGRKFWLVEAAGQMCLMEIVMAIVLATQLGASGTLPMGATIGLIVVVCVFIAGHAWGWGPMPWLICSEVQPLAQRPAGMALATSINFVLSFAVGQGFLSMMCAWRWGVFLWFAGWLAFMGIFTVLLVPETRGVPIEAIDGLFRKHWVWGRVVAAAERGDERRSSSDDVLAVKDVECKVAIGGQAPPKGSQL